MLALALGGGNVHGCAVVEGGLVQCWGTNFAGQLGDGSTTSSATATVDVVDLELWLLSIGVRIRSLF